MKPIFISYNDLKFDKHEKFTIHFSDEDSLTNVVFRKDRYYHITSMTYYVDLAVNITKLPKYDKIKQILDLATEILRGGIDLSYGKILLSLAKASGSSRTTFATDKSRQSKYIERVESFDVESKKTKEIYIYLLYKELQERDFHFLNSDRSSLPKSNTVSDDLKFLSRFFNDSAESFIDW